MTIIEDGDAAVAGTTTGGDAAVAGTATTDTATEQQQQPTQNVQC